jgi:hypothetical protein
VTSLDELKNPIRKKIERDSDSDKIKQAHFRTGFTRGVPALARLRQIFRNEMKPVNDQAPLDISGSACQSS